MTVRTKSAFPDISLVSEEERILRFKISDDTKDRYGDRIMAKGWRFDNYKKNPVLLFGHDYRQPAIGKATKVYVEGDAAYAEFKFAGPDVYPFADTIYRLMKPPESFMKAVSVGFDPDEDKIVVPKDQKERDELGLGPRGVMFNGQDLLEVSVVPVPANPNAVMNSVARGTITAREAEWLERAYGEFFEQIEEYAKSIGKVAKDPHCAKPGEEITLHSLQQEIRALASLVEKFGQKLESRPVEPSANEPHGGETPGADVYEKLFGEVSDLVETLKRT